MATRKKKKTAKKSKSSSRASGRRPRVKARPGGSKGPREAPREIAAFDPDAVESVFDVMPSDARLAQAADLLQGVAHPSRLKALIAMSVSELCVGDIAAVVGLSLSATSTMLKQLRGLGFLTIRNAGKQTYYRLTSDLPSELMGVVFQATDADPGE